MPVTITTTVAFSGQEQGWSETFSWSAATNNLNTAETLVTPLIQKRAALLASGYTLTVVKNAVVLDNAGQPVTRVTDIFEPRIAGNAGWPPSTPNLCLMCLWQTADNTQSKKQYMRGCPASIGDAGKPPNLATHAFGSFFNAWREAMVQFGAGWIVTSPAQTATIDTYTSVAQTGMVNFVFGANAVGGAGFSWPVAFGRRTRIYVSLPGKNPLDGPLVVVPSDATHAMTAEPIGVAPQVPGQIGVAEIRTGSLVTLQRISPQGPDGIIHPQRVVTHKTGRPTYASVGRRSGRPRW